MPTANCPKPSDRPSGADRPRRRVAVKVAFLLATAAAAGLVTWVTYQVHCYYSELRAKTILEAEVYSSEFGLRSLASVGGPTAEEAPRLRLSELRLGRLYVPIEHISVGGGGFQQLDQDAWDQLRAFRFLERIQISGCIPASNLSADFSGFTYLKRVDIHESPFSARDVRTLARLPELQDASFTKKQGIDAWLPSIGQLRHLRTLEIEGDVSDRGMESLAGLEALESLSVESDRITSKAVPALAKLKNLKALALSHTQIDDEGLRQLAALQGLKELHLPASNGISDEGVRCLAALESLEGLTLNSSRITSKSTPTLARLKSLKRLMLSKTAINDEGVRRLTELNDLEFLLLEGTAIRDFAGELRFPELGYLSLEASSLTDAGLRHISQSPKLRCLVIAGTRVTNASIETLAEMPSLMEVCAYDTQIDRESPQWLRLMKTLESKRAREDSAAIQMAAESE